MGEPRFGWDEIPLAYAMDTRLPMAWDGLERRWRSTSATRMSSSSSTMCEAVPLDELGPAIEHDPAFPERINVNVAQIDRRRHPAAEPGSAAPA